MAFLLRILEDHQSAFDIIKVDANETITSTPKKKAHVCARQKWNWKSRER